MELACQPDTDVHHFQCLRQQHTNAVYKAFKVHSILAYACVAIPCMMFHVLTN